MAFGRKKNAAPETPPVAVSESGASAGINVYLGAGTAFEGRLEYTGAAQISGVFKGEVVSQGSLSVGAGGQVEGDLSVGQLNVSGRLRGSATCTRKAVLLRNADFEGDLHTPKLEMETGAKFEGNISMPQAGGSQPK